MVALPSRTRWTTSCTISDQVLRLIIKLQNLTTELAVNRLSLDPLANLLLPNRRRREEVIAPKRSGKPPRKSNLTVPKSKNRLILKWKSSLVDPLRRMANRVSRALIRLSKTTAILKISSLPYSNYRADLVWSQLLNRNLRETRYHLLLKRVSKTPKRRLRLQRSSHREAFLMTTRS